MCVYQNRNTQKPKQKPKSSHFKESQVTFVSVDQWYIYQKVNSRSWLGKLTLNDKITCATYFLCSQSTDLVSGKKKIKILSTTLLLLNVMTLYKNEFYRLKHELVGPYMQIQPNHNSDTFVEKWLLYLITKLNNIYLIPEETSIPKISTRRAFLFL